MNAKVKKPKAPRVRPPDFVTKPIEKVSFASFFFGQGLIYAFVGGQYLLYFLTKHAQIDALIVSAILLVGKIWDAVNDTLFGIVVDKVRFKNGNKYKPWLWIASFLVPVFTVIMFCISPTMPLWMRITIFSIGYFLWDTAYTVCDAPAFALVTVMTPNVKERVGITTFASVGGVIATGLFSIAFVPFFNTFGGLSTSLLIAPISMLAMMLLCIFAKERARGVKKQRLIATPLPNDKSEVDTQEKIAGTLSGVENLAEGVTVKSAVAPDEFAGDTEGGATVGAADCADVTYSVLDGATADTADRTTDTSEDDQDEPALPPSPTLKETFKYLVKNKYMLLFYLYRIVSGSLFIQFTIYISDYYFGNANLVSIIMLMAIPLILIVYAFSGKISRRFDKIFVYKIAMIASMVLSVLIFIVGRYSMYIYAVGMAIYAALNILPGIYMTAIPGDCAEYGTYKTGTHNEGITFSLQTFTAKITSAISLSLSGVLLHVIGYDELNLIQAASTLNWMWALGTLLPVIAQIIGLPILFMYKLKDKDAQLMSDCNHNKITREECESKLSRKY